MQFGPSLGSKDITLGITEINLETIDLSEKGLRIKGNQVTAAGYYVKNGQAGLLYDVTFTSNQHQ
ncbi:MAG TPA: hypothetical protein VE954_15870 [Oligoflexus sp.]|uniref:hypothetical protein n=1 Tax=Oligoflexus sp. TaxID=1971216 RepID=UPI002D33D21D|nr:hypothetical protein [Oligoflexus sp.]HYX34577.1 hypothetical protein [Oligoflexus sp.]